MVQATGVVSWQAKLMAGPLVRDSKFGAVAKTTGTSIQQQVT
jgi:hypothetical protein